jgi:uncharacterized iron-regulated protein
LAVTRLAALTLLLLAVSACQAADWTHRHGADHPFAGAIVDLRSQRVIDEAALLAALGNADIVLLGETHDNRDHHLLQARLVGAMDPSVNGVVFEMIDTDRQQAVIEHLQEHPRDTAGLGAAIGWEESGWPDWSMYEPIAAATLAIDAQIVAGSLPREAIQGLLADGTKGLDPALAERTGLTEPLEPMLEANMLATISEAHCGLTPAERLPAMLLVQRGQDAMMADRLAAIRGRDKSVLIAGSGHVRRDWGVPLYLRRSEPGLRVLSVAFVEIDPELEALPIDLPYDFVWFTTRRQPYGFDPCKAFREQLQQIEARAAGLPTLG